MRVLRYLMLAAVAAALFLSSCGRKKESRQQIDLTPKTVVQPKYDVFEEEKEEEKPYSIYYKVILSGQTLSLYETDGESKKLITSTEISPEYYPEEDIKRLKNGIDVSFLEEGYEVLENFVN